MSDVNTFAGATLDRVADRRGDAAWVQAALQDPRSAALLVVPAGVPVTEDARPADVPLAAAFAVPGVDPGEAVLLGRREDGAPLFALDATDVPRATLAATLGGHGRIVGLRDAALRMATPDAGLLGYAQAMIAWQRRHRFCGACGAATRSEEAGHARACPRDGTMHHPRTDPVVIAVVTDADRLLLGRQAAWPRGRYSALAGFVEPGESLEEAVEREVAEEAGVEVGDIVYASSQPWPFPASLMMGFVARYAGGDPVARDGELEDVRWFGREEVAAAATEHGWTDGDPAGGLLLPPRTAIARRLIEDWLAH